MLQYFRLPKFLKLRKSKQVSNHRDVTLTIEPGVTVKFDKDKALLIDGTLDVRGTNAEKIIFTSNGEQKAGYWGFISFSDTSVDATFDENGNYWFTKKTSPHRRVSCNLCLDFSIPRKIKTPTGSARLLTICLVV